MSRMGNKGDGTSIQINGIPVVLANLAPGDELHFDGDFWRNYPASSGLVSSVTNSDGTITISPTSGAVVASLNLAQANLWTAPQAIQTTGGVGWQLVVNDATNGTGAISGSSSTTAGTGGLFLT